jgi:tRNA (uracil-5-)-methyltransferase
VLRAAIAELSTLLVDPPRAGLDPDTEALLREFEQVLYISCNPETLASNLRAVADTHAIARFAVFDQVSVEGAGGDWWWAAVCAVAHPRLLHRCSQFPYTRHLECGVLLKRKASG